MLLYLLSISDEDDHGKITELYEEYYKYLLKYSISQFRRYGRSSYMYDAEDAVQNTFVKLTQNIKKIDFSKGKKCVQGFIFTPSFFSLTVIISLRKTYFVTVTNFYFEPLFPY